MSCNSLYADVALTGRWVADEDGNPTNLAGGADGAWALGIKDYVAGPFGQNAFRFDGTNGIDVATDFIDATNDYSMFARVKFRTQTSLSASNFRPVLVQGTSTLLALGTLRNGDPQHNKPRVQFGSGNALGASAFGDSVWQSLGGSKDSTPKGYENGLEIAASPGSATIDSPSMLQFGHHDPSSARRIVADVADVCVFSRSLTAAEHLELHNGPEPAYLSGASLDSAGGVNVGNWNDQENGSVTYEWTVRSSDGTEVGSGTGATGSVGDLTEPSWMYVRASNDGGYDVGDFSSRSTSFGSSGDGYYEVAGVATDSLTLPYRPPHRPAFRKPYRVP